MSTKTVIKPAEMVKKLEEIVKDHGRMRGAAIPILQTIQQEFGFIPKELIPRLSALTGITQSDIYSILTFYSQFRFEPIGDNYIQVCHGTACHLAGAEEITNALKRQFDIGEHETTSPDKRFTIEKVACLGCCSLAPVMNMNEETLGRLSPAKAVKDAEGTDRGGEE